MNTPNGVTVGPNQKIWIADTSGNFFFSFDPETEEFTKYVTSIPHADSYGNLKLPTYSSNPYWIEHSDGNLVMNEHNANRIAVFNPESETLVEYTVPSRNPNWSDCEGIDYCGLAQVFDFTVDGDKIWFTEWVENNIGVVDMSVPLPFTIDIGQADGKYTDRLSVLPAPSDPENIVLERGQTIRVGFDMNPSKDFLDELNKEIEQQRRTQFSSFSSNISTTAPTGIDGLTITAQTLTWGHLLGTTVDVKIIAGWDALPGTHKVLLGAYNDEIAISKFITVTIV
jgi:virginiamycin B lyase